MYKIYIESRFFCNGKSFDQLAGVEETLEQAKRQIHIMTTCDHRLKHFSIVIREEY